MDLAFDFVEVLGALIFIWIVLFIPMPGVNAETSIDVQDESYSVEFLNSSTLPDGDYWGSHDMMSNEIRLATGWLPTYQFMSTCSHEVQHLEYDLEGDRTGDHLTTVEEHERMSGLGDRILPWNWEVQCVSLLPNRFNLA